MTFHLKSVSADLDASARPVGGEEKRAVLTTILERLGGATDLEEWMERSPLVEVEFAEAH